MKLKEVTDTEKYGHFIVGRKPPWYFTKPDDPPEYWDNSICFVNGFCIDLISMSRKESARGANYSCGELAEAATINGDRFWKEIFPTVRGQKGKYKAAEYLQWVFLSNIPWTQSGAWIFEYEKLAEETPEEVFYLESNILDAVKIYGRAAINRTKKIISRVDPLIWRVEYMNERLNTLPNAFYALFDDERHTYANLEDGSDPYYNPDAPIEISIDFNNYFNSLTIWQDLGDQWVCLGDLFVKGNQLLTDLILKFDKKFLLHLDKRILIYGDATGNNVLFNEKMTLFDKVLEILRDRGWDAELVTNWRSNPDHILKQQFINKALKGKNPQIPRIIFNEDHAAHTISSIKASPLSKKFKKDKSSENIIGIKPEKATHLSDTVDYYLMPKLTPYFSEQGNDSDYSITIY